jgi:antitoxin PrlF
MPSTVLTTKGQVTLPIEIRKELRLKAGDRIEFTKNAKTGRYELNCKTRPICELFGMLKYDGPPVSIEEMNETIADGWAGKLRSE